MLKKTLLLILSHLTIAFAGFSLGIYALPILIAPPAPSNGAMALAVKDGQFIGQFERDRKDSDWLHWAEGKVTVTPKNIIIRAELAPGPDYRLYLSPHFIETEQDFLQAKASLKQVGTVSRFNGSIHPLADDVDIEQYNTVIVWCETFSQFISSAQYKP